MNTEIIQIGNSRGVRIPKAMLEQSGLTGAVTLTVRDDEIIIRPAKAKKKPREGWEEAFKKLGPQVLTAEDKDWLNAPLTEWDKTEWTWPKDFDEKK